MKDNAGANYMRGPEGTVWLKFMNYIFRFNNLSVYPAKNLYLNVNVCKKNM